MGTEKKRFFPHQATLDFERKPHVNNHLFFEKVVDKAAPRLPAWRSFKADDSRLDKLKTACEARNVEEMIGALGFLKARSSSPRATQLILPDGKKPAAVFMLSDDEFTRDSSVLLDVMQADGISWGMLTNGSAWRLYNLSAFPPLEHYYEADLPYLTSVGGDELKYFLLYFSAHAFSPHERHGTFLDAVTALTKKAEMDIVSALTGAAANAAADLCRGFIRHEKDATGASPAGPGLDMIYRHALVVLYRIFYILISEARGTLPGSDPVYRMESLTAFADEAAEQKSAVPQNFPATYSAWPRLEKIFERAYRGDKALDIIPQTCEFLDAARHPFLLRNRIDDRSFQLAFGRIRNSFKGINAGFEDIHAAHAAEFLSHLPELQLNIAGEPMLAIIDDGKVSVLPAADVKWKKVIERINTGDAYLDRAAGPAVERERAGLDSIRAFAENSLAGTAERFSKKGSSAEQAIKDVSVFDPLCGSGELLMCAADFLGRRAASADPSQSHLFFKRAAIDNSLCGADPNPHIAELARFVITLYAAPGRNAPPAIEHRILAGNVLLGARLADIESSRVTDIELLAGAVSQRLAELAAESAAIDKHPAKYYGEACRKAASSRRMLKHVAEASLIPDLWTDSRMATRAGAAQIESALADFAANMKLRLKRTPATPLSPATDTSCPLHIEWAFPGIFFGAADAGFDIVISVLPAKFYFDAKPRAYLSRRLKLKGHFVFADALFKSMSPYISARGKISMFVPQRFTNSLRAKSIAAFLASEFSMKEENASDLSRSVSGKKFTALQFTRK